MLFAAALAFMFNSAFEKAQAAPLSKAHRVQALTLPITGTNLTNASLTIQRFITQNGQLAAVGTLTGTFTDPVTGAVPQITNALVTVPVSSITGSCQILNLVLGPLDLNVLGLQVHLNQVVLDITAQSGAGNLLGNLLCAVAHLLDNNGPLSGLVGLLNNILRQL